MARCTTFWLRAPAAVRDGPPYRATTANRAPCTRKTKSVQLAQPATLNQFGLHPGSGSELKNWPETKWAEMLQHLEQTTSSRLLLIGGEAEGERLGRLSRLAGMDPARIQVAQSLALVELASLMQKCAFFIGHDSGISHLAAALGLPGIILWGATAEEIWRPPSEHMVVLRHPAGLAQLAVTTVIETLDKLAPHCPSSPLLK